MFRKDETATLAIFLLLFVPMLSIAAGQDRLVDTTRFAGQFQGADLGAKIKAAFADCGHCKVVAIPGTITTDIIVPVGSVLELLPGALYNLSAHIYLYHRGAILEGNNSQMQCSVDDGTLCIQIGKNNVGTVRTDGSSKVTWNSGTDFSEIDAGDAIQIAGTTFNVAARIDSTHLVTTRPVILPRLAGPNPTYGVYVQPETNFGTSPESIVLRDLVLAKAGPIRTATQGIGCYFTTGARIENVRVQQFLNAGSYGYRSVGCLSAELFSFNSNVNGGDFDLEEGTSGGVKLGSNANIFFGGTATATGGARIQNSSLNKFFGRRWEGNFGKVSLLFGTNQFGNVCSGCYFERNGDGTPTSADIKNEGGPDWIFGSYFVSSPANHAATAIATSGIGAETYVANTYMAHAYTNALLSTDSGVNHRMSGVHTSGSVSGTAAPDIDEAGNSIFGAVTIGGGSRINRVLRETQTLTFENVSAGDCQEQTISFPGASTTSTVSVSPQSSPGPTLNWSGYVARDNGVTVRVCNPGVRPVVPKVVTWNTTVIQ